MKSALLLAFPWLLAAAGPEAASAPEPGAGAEWASHGGGADESGYSRLDEIKAANIDRLGLAWSLTLPDEVSLEATPLSVNGVIYFTGSTAIVYAVDAASGKLLWKYDPETWKFNPGKMKFLIYPVTRGVAYADGRIFSASQDGRLLALDAKAGHLLWSVETVDHDGMQTITGAPRTFNGKVIIGFGGADAGVRGYVTAYDARTGKQAWRFYTVPGTAEQNKDDPAMERAAATWTGDAWKAGPGGAVWDSITFDPGMNRIYIGTSNAAPYDPDKRSPEGGDNLYTSSIVALDADTGKYVWHYQVNPREAWDYDCTQRMTLADLVIDGKTRKVLMQAPKNGFFYVLDRADGRLISAEKIGKVTWADHIDLKTGRPVEARNIRYEAGDVSIWPSTVGAHSWQDMSYSPAAGLVYIPYMQAGTHFSRGKPSPEDTPVGGVNMGWAKNVDPMDGKGALVAWDPVHQTQRWRVPLDTMWNGGTLATAGNLVFQGTADGYLSAYEADTGKKVWQFNAGLGIIAAPISYSIGGEQYVSVLVGYGGSAGAASNLMHVGWKFGAQPRLLLTFRLDGKANLLPSAPRRMTVQAVDDPSFQIKDADVAVGRAIFNGCMGCHGRNLVSAGAPAPDLRESKIALDPDSLWSVVHDGTLMQQGMPRYEMLTREQVMDLYAYIRAGARAAIKAAKIPTD